jgi:hypothetical protein
LYSTIIPGGAFLTIVGLCLYYWVDKFNLLRRSSVTHNISGKMVMTCLKLLDMSLFLKPLGSLIFNMQIRDGADITSIILGVMGIAYLVLPVDKLLEYFNEE